jgi:hypothetical protein
MRFLRRIRGRYRFVPSVSLGALKVGIRQGDRKALLRLIAHLSRRRALYDPFESENREYVARSILEMRGELAAALGELAESSRARPRVQRMLDACGAFQTAEQEAGQLAFFLALGWLRGYLGAELTSLSKEYCFHIEGPLSSLLVQYDPRGEPLPHEPPIIDIGRELRTIYVQPLENPAPLSPGSPEDRQD